MSPTFIPETLQVVTAKQFSVGAKFVPVDILFITLSALSNRTNL